MAKKLTAFQKAERRAKLLKKAGVDSDLLARYSHNIKLIQKSSMSRRQKTTAENRIARQFLKAKGSTVAGIKQTFGKMVKSGMISEKGAAYAHGDVGKMAEYMDASKSARRFMEAKELGMSSSQIKLALDMLSDTSLTPSSQSAKLMSIMSKVTDEVMATPGRSLPPSEIEQIIFDEINPLLDSEE